MLREIGHNQQRRSKGEWGYGDMGMEWCEKDGAAELRRAFRWLL